MAFHLNTKIKRINKSINQIRNEEAFKDAR